MSVKSPVLVGASYDPTVAQIDSAIPVGAELPQGDDKARAVRSMFDTIAPRYDLVNRIMTFRLDVAWRTRTVTDLSLAGGSTVLDLACGTGDFCRELTDRGLLPIGVDLSAGMLQHARTTAPLMQADVLRLPFADASVDGATCGFALRNFVALNGFFEELARVIKPAGRIALLEVCEPPNPILKAGHGIYFGKVVPLIGGLLSDKGAYDYLPRSVSYLPPTDELLAQISSAGFTGVRRDLLTGGIAQLITATRSAG